jgi:hypothetical protein
MQFGVDVETALNEVANRMANDDLLLLTTAIVVQQQVGGNLSEIIDTISKTIRDRLAIKRSIKTLTAQGRISGKIIGVYHCHHVGSFCFNPEYMAPMFSLILAVSCYAWVSYGMHRIFFDSEDCEHKVLSGWEVQHEVAVCMSASVLAYCVLEIISIRVFSSVLFWQKD